MRLTRPMRLCQLYDCAIKRTHMYPPNNERQTSRACGVPDATARKFGDVGSYHLESKPDARSVRLTARQHGTVLLPKVRGLGLVACRCMRTQQLEQRALLSLCKRGDELRGKAGVRIHAL